MLKSTGITLRFVHYEDQTRLATYYELKTVLDDIFKDKAPKSYYFQKLSVIQQRRGEIIESICGVENCMYDKTSKYFGWFFNEHNEIYIKRSVVDSLSVNYKIWLLQPRDKFEWECYRKEVKTPR